MARGKIDCGDIRGRKRFSRHPQPLLLKSVASARITEKEGGVAAGLYHLPTPSSFPADELAGADEHDPFTWRFAVDRYARPQVWQHRLAVAGYA